MRAAVAAAAAWRTAASMPERRSYFAAAAIGGEIYVSGGMVGATGKYVQRLERFDPRRETWRRLPDQPQPARAAAGTAYRGSLYVLGGQIRRGHAARARVRPAHPPLVVLARRCPSRATTLRRRRSAAGCTSPAASAGSIPSARCSSSTADRWRAVAPLPQALHTEALVAYGGSSGRSAASTGMGDAVRSVWIYSPRTDRWRAGPRLAGPWRWWERRPRAARSTPSPSAVFERYVPGTGWVLGPRLRCPATRSGSSRSTGACGRSAGASCRSSRTRAWSRTRPLD